MKLSEVVVIRISVELKRAIEERAKQLRIRPIDLIRWSLSQAVSQQNTEDVVSTNRNSSN